MLKLLRESQMASAFKSLSESQKDLVIAVPFWGLGAAKRLGISSGGSARVVCNLDSRGCNPRAILELKKLGVKIRTNRRLHAKIYASGASAIVGSSNASFNGITLEDDTLRGSIEANILTDNAGLVSDARTLFEAIWSDKATIKVSAPMIARAIKDWDARPPVPAPALPTDSLLEACRQRPDLFASVFVVAYDGSMSKKARRIVAQIGRESRLVDAGQPEAAAVPRAKESWFCQFQSAVPPGSLAIDLDCRGKDPKVWGVVEIPDPVRRYPVEGEDDLTEGFKVPRGKVTLPDVMGSFRLSPADKAFLVAHGRKIIKKFGDVAPLHDVLRAYA